MSMSQMSYKSHLLYKQVLTSIIENVTKIQQTVVLLIPGHRQKDKQYGLHIKNSLLNYKE